MTGTHASLDPAALLRAVIAFRDRMLAREDEVNGLNVFPVPDGDTGTNVLLTLEAALAAVDPALAIHDPDGSKPAVRGLPPAAAVPGDDPSDLARLCQALTRGIILGARGSSGVILSQALVAALATVADSTDPPTKTLAAALEQARAAAYGAVAQPVEGTILTVLSAAAAAASAAADLPLPDLTELVAVEARAAVARTPTLLPVLARAGVVDSGGRALSYGFDALAEVVGGRLLPPPPPVGHAVLTPADADNTALILPTGQPPEGGGRYEVVASLHTDESGAGRVRDRWRALGDAVVVSGAGSVWRGHVHTDDPEGVLVAARELLGDTAVEGVTLTDLYAQVAAQHRSGHAVLTPADADNTALTSPTGQPPEGGGRYEVVASLHTDESGAGRVRDRWRALGDAVVVSGAGSVWRGHVHTDDPEGVLVAARELLGDTAVDDVTLTDLQAQMAAQQQPSPPSLAHVDRAPRPQPAAAALGVVAVVEGAGLVHAYTELGGTVIDVGDAAPSVQDLLEAIEGSPVGEVIVLPNDSNVAPAATQAGELASKPVHVLPARHPLAGLAALVAFDPTADRDTNLAAMRAALARTRAGRVAPVAREAVVAVGPVHPGQWLAIAEREVVGVGSTPVEAALALADHLVTPRTELITLAWGPAVTAEQVDQLREEIARRNPGDVVDAFDAGHHDAFLISCEDLPDEEGASDLS